MDFRNRIDVRRPDNLQVASKSSYNIILVAIIKTVAIENINDENKCKDAIIHLA